MQLTTTAATISNNVPITEWSIGSDTSINVVVEACDAIRQSASASRSRVFVIETQGGECGYLAVVGALAVRPRLRTVPEAKEGQSGAIVVYTPEEPIKLGQLASDVEFLKKRYRTDVQGKSEGRIVIRSEKSSPVYTTEVITEIFKDEGGKLFDARSVSLGHTLQGGTPSPRDRTRAVRLAVKCLCFLEKHCQHVEAHDGGENEGRNTVMPSVSKPDGDEHNIATVVISGSEVRFAELPEMVEAADWVKRAGKKEEVWWWRLKRVVEIMGGRHQGRLSAVRPNPSLSRSRADSKAGSDARRYPRRSAPDLKYNSLPKAPGNLPRRQPESLCED